MAEEAFDSFNTCASAYFCSPSLVPLASMGSATEKRGASLATSGAAAKDLPGLSRWQYVFAFAAVLGVEPSRADLIDAFGEDEVVRTDTACDLSCEEAPPPTASRGAEGVCDTATTSGDDSGEGTPWPGGMGSARRIRRAAFVDRIAAAAPFYSAEMPDRGGAAPAFAGQDFATLASEAALWASFDAIDEQQKGYISEDDFTRVVCDALPQMPRADVARWFANLLRIASGEEPLDGVGKPRVLFRDFEKLLWYARSLPPVLEGGPQ